MPIIDGKKYACASCIKGHRSSSCAHTDRPVFEIKRKGRPVSQCENCRELRKTNSLHVKCICKNKDKDSGSPTPSTSRTHIDDGPSDPKGPNFKALRAIHRATIQKAFMCQCLNGGSCVCDSHADQLATDSDKAAAGAKRKQLSGATIQSPLSAKEEPSDRDDIPVSKPSCCSSKKQPMSRTSSCSTKLHQSIPSLPQSNVSSDATPPLTSASMSSSALSLPELPLELDSSIIFTPRNPLYDAKGSDLYSTSNQPDAQWPGLQLDQQQILPTSSWSSSTSTAFDDWVWGDILVPDSLLPPPEPSMLEAIAQGACRSCGPGCKCGEGQCQCGHVQALQKSLLQSTADPLDRAFAESVLGLPLTFQFLDQTSTIPFVGNQPWSAGHMPVITPGAPMLQLPPLEPAYNANLLTEGTSSSLPSQQNYQTVLQAPSNYQDYSTIDNHVPTWTDTVEQLPQASSNPVHSEGPFAQHQQTPQDFTFPSMSPNATDALAELASPTFTHTHPVQSAKQAVAPSQHEASPAAASTSCCSGNQHT